jgi:hypothetical protein
MALKKSEFKLGCMLLRYVYTADAAISTYLKFKAREKCL